MKSVFNGFSISSLFMNTYSFLSLGILWSASNFISPSGFPRNSNVIKFLGRSPLSIVFIRFPDKNLRIDVGWEKKTMKKRQRMNEQQMFDYSDHEYSYKVHTILVNLMIFPICLVSLLANYHPDHYVFHMSINSFIFINIKISFDAKWADSER